MNEANEVVVNYALDVPPHIHINAGFFVIDGFLNIKDIGTGRVLATYSPGNWCYVITYPVNDK